MDTELTEFIKNELKVAAVAPDDDLFAMGLDSFSVSQIALFIETKFGIKLEIDNAFTYDNFSSLKNIDNLIQTYGVLK